jgi:ribosomal protein S10
VLRKCYASAAQVLQKCCESAAYTAKALQYRNAIAAVSLRKRCEIAEKSLNRFAIATHRRVLIVKALSKRCASASHTEKALRNRNAIDANSLHKRCAVDAKCSVLTA